MVNSDRTETNETVQFIAVYNYGGVHRMILECKNFSFCGKLIWINPRSILYYAGNTCYQNVLSSHFLYRNLQININS
jgi:hypothetical protein